MSKLRANSYIIFDYETGGLASKSSDPNMRKLPDPKVVPIVEFAAIVLNGSDLSEILRYENIIRPYDDKLEYQEGATKIHGISKAKALKEGISLKQFGQDFVTLCKEAGDVSTRYAKPVMVAHNCGYDNPFTEDLCERERIDPSKILHGYVGQDGKYKLITIDTIIDAKKMWGGDPSMTSFNLKACCDKAGVDLVDAHRAMPDVESLADLFRYFVQHTRTGTGNLAFEGGRYRKSFQF